MKIRNNIKSWCRYWHFNISGVLSDNETHQTYLHITEILDDWFDTDTWDKGINDAWVIILDNLNKCDEHQLNKLQDIRNN